MATREKSISAEKYPSMRTGRKRETAAEAKLAHKKTVRAPTRSIKAETTANEIAVQI
jgi:hypothetical protein